MTSDNNIRMNLAVMHVLDQLKRKGYKLMLRREATCLYCNELRQWIMPENFSVDEFFFLGELAAPDADRMLYAISLWQGGKGFLIDTCYVYTDSISPEMMKKLEVKSYTSIL